ncbi:MAG: thiamine phosphate synthase [Mariprofundus sp.]
MRCIPPTLTLITDTSRFSGEPFFSAVERALIAGVDAILVREKELSSAKLLALAARLREMTRLHHARLIIHTQADIAEAVDADGLHLCSHDIGAIANVRSWLNDSTKTVSTSCHHAQQLNLSARAGADYATLSPIFPTPSHPGAACLGIDEFRRLADQALLPVVALGGITSANCMALKWPHIAVISAILAADDIEQCTATLSASALAASPA